MKKKYITIILAIFITNVAYTQDENFSQTAEIKKHLSEGDVQKVEQAEQLMDEGFAYIDKAQIYRDKADSLRNIATKQKKRRKKRKYIKEAKKMDKKALELKRKGAVKLSKSYKIIYNTYKTNLLQFRASATEEKINEVRELEDRAEKLYKQSKAKLKLAANEKEPSKAYDYYSTAEQLEDDAVRVQIQAYAIYLGWYDEPEEETKDKDTSEVIIQDTVPQQKEEAEVITIVDEKPKDNIIFKIQIAASRVPLSVEKLRSIYKGDMLINNENTDGWYRYTIGRYKTYEEAFEAEKKINVKGSFIVAYKNGERIQDIKTVANPKQHPAVMKNKIEYRIQIGSSRTILSESELKRLNKTAMEVKRYKAGNIYKYTIGSFSSVQEAEKFRKQNGYDNTNSFIVKYKNGKEIR